MELTAFEACKLDAQILYNKFKNGQVFGAFNKHEREAIWAEIYFYTTNRLVFSFFSFFKNINWLKNLINYVKQLVHLSSWEIIFFALE